MQSTLFELPVKKVVLYLRILYPVWMIVGMFGLLYVPSVVVVEGNAASTVAHLLNNELLFRFGIVGGLVTQLLHIVAVVLLYRLFVSVHRTQAKLLLLLGLIGVPIAMISSMPQLGALLLAEGPSYLASFTTAQRESLVLFFLDLHQIGITIASIFWGLWLLPLGYLSSASQYFPKFVAVALYIGGIGYALGAITTIVLPDGAVLRSLFDFMTFGEIVFIVGLFFIRSKAWKQ